jgi:predicted nuclease of predicted toxin-antitoxin system
MRFLVDTNLPPALAEWLVSEGYEALHTRDLGMAAAKDREIWAEALASGSCIVTKDEDFVLLRAGKGEGPSIVWVRIGNAVRKVIIQRLAAAWPAVMTRLEQGDNVVEIR